jgi:putative addiction module CopG family antidote
MNVTLTPRAEALLRHQVETGRYTDPGVVVQEALELLDERDRLERLKSALASGDEQYARGQVKTWTPDTMDRLKREAAGNENNKTRVPL